MINFSTFTIVAHRNMISLFDMGSVGATKDQWEDTLDLGAEDTLDLGADHVRRLCIKKRMFGDRKNKDQK